MKDIGNQAGVFCLNRGWKFINKDISILPPTKDHIDVYSFAKGGAARGPAAASFDDSDWEKVSLPHDWVTKKPFTEEGSPNQGYKERGVGWYRIKFNLDDEDRDKQILLEFEGMSCDAEIYCNGMLLKRNFSGYKSFAVDMTDMAHFGVTPNVLAVRIDASAWEGWWYEGAGIYRNVWLIKKAAVHIAYNGSYLKPLKQDDGTWQLEVATNIENSFENAQKYSILTEIYDNNGEVICQNSIEGQVAGFSDTISNQIFSIYDVEVWSVETPTLYKAKTTVIYNQEEKDFLVTEFGFRSISIDAETGFYLNGKNIKLKGFCNHQDHAGVGVAVPYAVKEYRVTLLKELGANAYRCAHNTDPEILEICDRLGMLVMEENRTFSSAEDNLQRVKEMIKNSRNHPSVIMYSIFNEEPLQGTAKGRRIAGRLQAAVKSLDDTRPVLGAFNGGYMEDEGAATILDVVGINYNPAAYDKFHEKYPDTPLLGSETASAFMVRGEHETDKEAHIIDNYDQECAPWGNTVRDAWRWVDERPFVAGTFVWTGFDYRGEPTPFEWPSVSTFFGTYDSCGFEKDCCYLYKAFWREKPLVHIVPQWNLDVEEGTPVKVMAFTNCEEVEIFLNGKSIGRKKSDKYEQVSFQVPYQAGNLKAIAYINGEKMTEDEVITAGEAVKLRAECSKTTMKNDGHDAVAVNVYAVDKNGVRVPDADNLLSFELEGGAKIIGVGNGNPNSHEPDLASYRKLYNGYAQAILLNTGNQDLRVKVKADGLKTVEVKIKVEEKEHIPYIKVIEEEVIQGWKMYHSLFDERPDPDPVVEKNDMNSFEPLSFTGKTQPIFSGGYLKYGLYRVVLDIGKEGIARNLYFPAIKGKSWVFLDGRKIGGKDSDGSLSIELAKELEGEHVLTVIVQNIDKNFPEAGICAPVCLKRV